MGNCLIAAAEFGVPKENFDKWESFDYKNHCNVYSNEQQTEIFTNLPAGSSIKYKIGDTSYTAIKLDKGPNIGCIRQTNEETKKVQIFYQQTPHASMSIFDFDDSNANKNKTKTNPNRIRRYELPTNNRRW